MSRSLTMLFAIICYAIFFATFLYLIAFVGNLPVPKTVDAPISMMPRAEKLIITHELAFRTGRVIRIVAKDVIPTTEMLS